MNTATLTHYSAKRMPHFRIPHFKIPHFKIPHFKIPHFMMTHYSAQDVTLCTLFG